MPENRVRKYLPGLDPVGREGIFGGVFRGHFFFRPAATPAAPPLPPTVGTDGDWGDWAEGGKRAEKTEKETMLQGEPNVSKIAPEASKYFLCHVWTYISSKQRKKGVFFRFYPFPNQTSLAGATIFDWSTIPHCTSRRKLNWTKLFSSKGDRFESWPFFAFRYYLAPPV